MLSQLPNRSDVEGQTHTPFWDLQQLHMVLLQCWWGAWCSLVPSAVPRWWSTSGWSSELCSSWTNASGSGQSSKHSQPPSPQQCPSAFWTLDTKKKRCRSQVCGNGLSQQLHRHTAIFSCNFHVIFYSETSETLHWKGIDCICRSSGLRDLLTLVCNAEEQVNASNLCSQV